MIDWQIESDSVIF